MSADLTFERFKAALEGDARYPQSAIFVDVVLVYPDGVERIVEAASPTEEAG